MLGTHLFIQNKICRIFIAFHDISVHRCSRRTNHRAVFLWQPFEIARVVRWSEGNYADVSQLSCDSYDCRWTNVRASWEISWTCFGHADTSAVLTFFNCIALFMNLRFCQQSGLRLNAVGKSYMNNLIMKVFNVFPRILQIQNYISLFVITHAFHS